jgi:hypothetical protein
MSSLFNTLYHGTPTDISDVLERMSQEVATDPALLGACLAGLAKNLERIERKADQVELADTAFSSSMTDSMISNTRAMDRLAERVEILEGRL